MKDVSTRFDCKWMLILRISRREDLRTNDTTWSHFRRINKTLDNQEIWIFEGTETAADGRLNRFDCFANQTDRSRSIKDLSISTYYWCLKSKFLSNIYLLNQIHSNKVLRHYKHCKQQIEHRAGLTRQSFYEDPLKHSQFFHLSGGSLVPELCRWNSARYVWSTPTRKVSSEKNLPTTANARNLTLLFHQSPKFLVCHRIMIHSWQKKTTKRL
jgi:hypothetical protein